MKLKHLLSGLSLLSITALHAQQLTSAILPAAGSSVIFGGNTSQTAIAPGPAGDGVTWDFSSLVSASSYTATFYGPNQNPTGLTCSGTTLTEADFASGNPSPVASTNFLTSASTYEVTCVNVPSQQVEYTYSNTQKLLSFPVSYQDNVSDNFSGTGTISGTPIITNGTMQYEVDGRGTLILSSGTYTNVLRIRRTSTQYVIISDPDFGDDTLNITTGTIYEFYRPGSKLTLLYTREQTQEIPLTGQSFTSYNFILQDGLNSISENLLVSPVELYPNPATGNATLAVNLKQQANIAYNVIDATGRTVRNFNQANVNAGQQNFTIDLAGLSSGLYMIHYTVNGQSGYSKLFVR